MTGVEDLTVDDKSDGGFASTSGEDEENVGREPNLARDTHTDRMPLRESQMTVPETPSPDLLAAGKGAAGRRRDFLAPRNLDNASPPKGCMRRNATAAVSTSGDQVKSSYNQICSIAEKIFNRIRQGVTCQAAPSSLKSAFLEPLSSKLASHMAIDLLACTDDEFMAMFTGKLSCSALFDIVRLCMFLFVAAVIGLQCCHDSLVYAKVCASLLLHAQ